MGLGGRVQKTRRWRDGDAVKLFRWDFFTTAAILLAMAGFAALDVPATLPQWRWVLGVCLLTAAAIVGNKPFEETP